MEYVGLVIGNWKVNKYMVKYIVLVKSFKYNKDRGIDCVKIEEKYNKKFYGGVF